MRSWNHLVDEDLQKVNIQNQTNAISPTNNDASIFTAGGVAIAKDLHVGESLFVVSVNENGVVLSKKYLGIAAKAADSDKLNGLNSSAFLTHLPHFKM